MAPYQPSPRFWLAVTLALLLAFGTLCRFVTWQAAEYARQEYEINAVVQQHNSLTFERDRMGIQNVWLTDENERLERTLKWHRLQTLPAKPD